MAINHIKAVADALGNGILELNGVDMADQIEGLQVMTAVGQPTQVFLALRAGVHYEGDAEVSIVGSAAGSAQDVADLVGQLSGRALEQRALDALQWGDDEPLAQRITSLIKDEAQAYADQLGGRTKSS